MATSKMHVMSPAPSKSYRPGAIQQITWAEFSRRATRFDAEGSPIEGVFGCSWAAKTDLRSSTEEQIKASIREACRAVGEEPSAARIKRDTKMLLTVYNTLKKGDVIALKKGINIIAFAEITSDYCYCPEERWGWHSWSYRVVRKATAADQPANKGALVKTFFPHFLTRPTL